MSLKDHLRSLGDKEFLEELASSEGDEALDEANEEDSSRLELEEAEIGETGEEEAEVLETSEESDESQPEVISSAGEISSRSQRKKDIQPADSRPAPKGLEAVQAAVVAIEADAKTGRGFVVDAEGRIATNLHLVEGASRIRVNMPSGDIFLGKILKTERSHDLALIQIPARTSGAVKLADAEQLDVGEDAYVLGKASSALGKMVRAVICGLRVMDGTALIQVNQSIAETDTGSPFVFPDGSVIGISNSTMGDDIADSGFAVSVKDLKVFITSR